MTENQNKKSVREDKRRKENLQLDTPCYIWTFQGMSIRVIEIDNILYFGAIDIGYAVADNANTRSLILRYIADDDLIIIHRGKKPIKFVTVSGAIQILDHLPRAELAPILKTWLLDTAIPSYYKGNHIQDYDLHILNVANTDELPVISCVDEKKSDMPNIFNESNPVILSFAYNEQNTIHVQIAGDMIWFDLAEIMEIFHLPLQDYFKIIPANRTCMKSFSAETTTKPFRDKIRCLNTAGVLNLSRLAPDANVKFENWFTQVLLKSLKKSQPNYLPDDLYDILIVDKN